MTFQAAWEDLAKEIDALREGMPNQEHEQSLQGWTNWDVYETDEARFDEVAYWLESDKLNPNSLNVDQRERLQAKIDVFANSLPNGAAWEERRSRLQLACKRYAPPQAEEEDDEQDFPMKYDDDEAEPSSPILFDDDESDPSSHQPRMDGDPREVWPSFDRERRTMTFWAAWEELANKIEDLRECMPNQEHEQSLQGWTNWDVYETDEARFDEVAYWLESDKLNPNSLNVDQRKSLQAKIDVFANSLPNGAAWEERRSRLQLACKRYAPPQAEEEDDEQDFPMKYGDDESEPSSPILFDDDESDPSSQMLFEEPARPQPLSAQNQYANPIVVQSCASEQDMLTDVEALLADMPALVDISINGIPSWHATDVIVSFGEGTPAQKVRVKNETFSHTFELPAGQYSVSLAAEDNTISFLPSSMSLALGESGYEWLHFDADRNPCRFTCLEDCSLPVADGCVTGYELLHAGYEALRTYMNGICLTSNGRLQSIDDSSNQVKWGADWLRLAGRLHALTDNMQATSFNKAVGLFAMYWNNDSNGYIFDRTPTLEIGNDQVKISRVQENFMRQHPRILYQGCRCYHEKYDLPYSDIAVELAHGRTQSDAAKDILTLLQTGTSDTEPYVRQFDSSFLVHVFGVECNKNNLTYLTALMALELVKYGQIGFWRLLHDFDQKDKYKLKERGGLLGMASYQSGGQPADTNALIALTSDDLEKANKHLMGGVHSHLRQRPNQNLVILTKEMMTIVKWCKLARPDHASTTREGFLEWLKGYLPTMLQSYYPRAIG